jgi:hypothetical protein
LVHYDAIKLTWLPSLLPQNSLFTVMVGSIVLSAANSIDLFSRADGPGVALLSATGDSTEGFECGVKSLTDVT